MKAYRWTYGTIKLHSSLKYCLFIVLNKDECHPIKTISSLFACAKQQPGNTTEKRDVHRRTAHPPSERPGTLQGRSGAGRKSRYGEFDSPSSHDTYTAESSFCLLH